MDSAKSKVEKIWASLKLASPYNLYDTCVTVLPIIALSVFPILMEFGASFFIGGRARQEVVEILLHGDILFAALALFSVCFPLLGKAQNNDVLVAKGALLQAGYLLAILTTTLLCAMKLAADSVFAMRHVSGIVALAFLVFLASLAFVAIIVLLDATSIRLTDAAKVQSRAEDDLAAKIRRLS